MPVEGYEPQRRYNAAAWLLAFVLPVAPLAGCGESSKVQASASNHDREHDCDHADHNPGCDTDPFHSRAHETSSHRPKGFSDAVADLRARTASLTELGAKARSGKSWQGAVDKLADIVRWLPEIAADSDMPENEWDRVNEQSKALTQLVEPLVSSVHRGEAIDMPSAMALWSRHLSELEAVAAQGDWQQVSVKASQGASSSSSSKPE